METRIILGTDCSFRNLGWSICKWVNNRKLTVLATGVEVIKTERKPKRLKTIQDLDDTRQLAAAVLNVLHTAISVAEKDKTRLVWAFEVPMGSKSARANRLLGMATGVLGTCGTILASEELATIYEIKPSEVKNKVGKRDASKEDIIKYVAKFGKFDYPKSKMEHIADSIVIAEVAALKLEEKEDEHITE